VSLSRFPRTVDDVTVRVIAAEVLVVAVLAVATRQPWLYAVLAVDFLLRSAAGPVFSPLARLAATRLRPRLGAAPRPTPGPPKRFAAAIGAALTIIAPVAYYALDWHTVTWVVGAVMVVFPALEAGLGLCVGCLVFRALMRAHVIPASVCLDCADITRRPGAVRSGTSTAAPIQVVNTLSR
jgi:hypothetical protein